MKTIDDDTTVTVIAIETLQGNIILAANITRLNSYVLVLLFCKYLCGNRLSYIIIVIGNIYFGLLLYSVCSIKLFTLPVAGAGFFAGG